MAKELQIYLLAIYKFMKLNAADILKLCHKPGQMFTGKMGTFRISVSEIVHISVQCHFFLPQTTIQFLFPYNILTFIFGVYTEQSVYRVKDESKNVLSAID